MPKTGGAFSLPHAAVFKMKLILMRHTQAEWGFGIEDHERALSAKGLAEAGRLGLWLTENYHPPSHALISDANRTQQTFAALNQTCTAAVLPELYLATPEDLLLAVQNRETDCLLVLAHNPGIARAWRGDGHAGTHAPKVLRLPSGGHICVGLRRQNHRRAGH